MKISSINNNNPSFGLIKVPDLSTLSDDSRKIVEGAAGCLKREYPGWLRDNPTVFIFPFANHERTFSGRLREAKITHAKIDDKVVLNDGTMRQVVVNNIHVINGNPAAQIDSHLLGDLAVTTFVSDHIHVIV